MGQRYKIINNLPCITLALLYNGVPKKIPTYSPVPLLYASIVNEGVWGYFGIPLPQGEYKGELQRITHARIDRVQWL